MYRPLAHRRVQRLIEANDEKIFAAEPAVLEELRSFCRGRYRSLTHRGVIASVLAASRGGVVLDVGCKNAQIGLELLRLDPAISYLGIEKEHAEAEIARRRLEADEVYRGRYRLFVGDVFEVLKAGGVEARVVLTTWAPMIEVGTFIAQCLPHIAGWSTWLVEYQLESYRQWCEKAGSPLKRGYHTYTDQDIRTLTAGLGRGRVSWSSRLSRVSRVLVIQGG